MCTGIYTHIHVYTLVYTYTHLHRTGEIDEVSVKLTLELPASLVSLALSQKCLGYKFDLLLINEVSLGVSGEPLCNRRKQSSVMLKNPCCLV